MSELVIDYWLANLYETANSLDKAEACYREVAKLNPNSSNTMNNLGGFLIKYDRGLDEGISLVSEALRISPENGFILWNKVIGYYKQGKYKEALDLLLKAQNWWSAINPELEKDIQNVKDAINRK